MSDKIGTISIVSHGHGTMISTLLDDLSRQAGIGDWHVVLTMNVPEPFENSSGLPLTVIENEVPLGFGKNHNQAVKAAQGELFVILNPDIRLPEADTLQRLTRLNWGEVAMLRAPVILSSAGKVEDSVRTNLTPWAILARAMGRRRVGRSEGPSHFRWFAGMFLVVRKDQFLALGGFDERFHLYCEDYDLCARWRLNGGLLEQITDLAVFHDAQRDSHRSLRHLRWHLGSLLRVWASHPVWRIALGSLARLPPATWRA